MTGAPTRSIARFTVATSSDREWRGSCTAITLCPAFCRMGITLLHEEPSTPVPWTRTIFMFVAFVVVVVMRDVPWDRINVLLLFCCCCTLTIPECAILNVRHTTNAVITYDKRTIVILGIFRLEI